ncbi:hypothetical protein QUA74_11050 [Microcoleus sp. LAD1_D3]|uniref:hypothetical protein n=1 Tax=Microcoleus sp. LAD1_D3 TaxID=2819365 RepID=UPI002FD6C4D0
MPKTHVIVPLFHTNNEGWYEAKKSIVAGSSVLLSEVKKCAPAYLHVCEFEDGTPAEEIKALMSEGMKECHQTAQEEMVNLFGDDWRNRAFYSFGELEYTSEAVFTPQEEAYLNS